MLSLIHSIKNETANIKTHETDEFEVWKIKVIAVGRYVHFKKLYNENFYQSSF
jgi:hypothetical protein